MFIQNARQAFRSVLAALLICAVFPTGSAAEDNKVDANVLAAIQTQSTVSVAIYLKDKPPSKQISDAVKAKFQPDIEAKAAEIRDKSRPFRRRNQPLPPNVKAELKVMHQSLDKQTGQMRREIGRRLKDYVAASQQRVRQAIEKAGGTVYAQVAIGNIIGAQLPATVVNQIAALNDVGRIELDPEVVIGPSEPTENHRTRATGIIEEDIESFMVTVITGGAPEIHRSDTEILADRILLRETEDILFDDARRDKLIKEIDWRLEDIRAAYPTVSTIHALDDYTPDAVKLYLEPGLNEIVTNLIQDKEGPVPFKTGYAEFDTLNMTLGLRAVHFDEVTLKGIVFYFDKSLNFEAASEAYSKVKGVEFAHAMLVPRDNINSPMGVIRSDYPYDTKNCPNIGALKEAGTWYFIFRSPWGDCVTGCRYQELFCFMVNPSDVTMVPITQASDIRPFQTVLSRRGWVGRNMTPFINSSVYTWSWSEGQLIELDSANIADFDAGCPILGEFEVTPTEIRLSCGYQMSDPLPDQASHSERDGKMSHPLGYSSRKEDQSIEEFEFTGVVLLLVAMQHRVVPGQGERYAAALTAEPLRVVKTAAEVESPENVVFEDVSIPIDAPAPSGAFERWWGVIRPTFVICWDHPHTGQRAYQFLLPDIYRSRGKIPPKCTPVKKDNWYHAWYLGVWAPLLDKYAVRLGIEEGVSVVPDREDWTDWIDEVLPRPAAPRVKN